MDDRKSRLADSAVSVDPRRHVPSPDQLPLLDVEALRASIRNLSAIDEPHDWASQNLILGAALCSRARGTTHTQAADSCKAIIGNFEASLEIYCRRDWLTLQGAEADVDGSTQIHPNRAISSDEVEALRDADRKESEGIQLIVDATSVSLTGSADLLDRAAVLFRENCAPRTRERNFRQWVVNLSNLGCVLTLLAKSNTRRGGAALLEEAMDAFGALLNEPALREMDGQYASVHVNLADAFQVLAELALPAERVGYLERAIHSLTAALEAVAPERLKPLLRSVHMPVAC